MTEWGIPEAISHLEKLYEKLETVQSDLGKFVSYSDEAREESDGDALLVQLARIICKLEDSTDSIRIKTNSLLEWHKSDS